MFFVIFVIMFFVFYCIVSWSSLVVSVCVVDLILMWCSLVIIVRMVVVYVGVFVWVLLCMKVYLLCMKVEVMCGFIRSVVVFMVLFVSVFDRMSMFGVVV